MTRKKSHDEVYCRSCGSTIKKKAEICPDCGVKNKFQEKNKSNSNTGSRSRVEVNVGTNNQNNNAAVDPPKNSQSKTADDSTSSSIESLLNTEPNDPSNHSTNVSNNWGYGVSASIIFWVTSLILSGIAPSVSLLALIGWILMPASIYFDSEYLKSTTTWKPSMPVWIILSITPLINIVAGGVYLFRRYNTEKISAPKSNTYKGTSGDPAVQELKERYSRGEISDTEFESQLEQIMQAKEKDTEDEVS